MNPEIPVSQQCELLSLPRSSFYYKPEGEDDVNLELMRMIDEEYTRHPFYGARRMAAWLRARGFSVNRKRVSRLMRLMGITAIYPKQRLSLQRHRYRMEHWYIVRGCCVVSRDNEIISLKECQAVDNPQGAWHRITNTGHEDLIIIETQTGEYFGEDDIERSEDDYGRV